MNILFVVRLDAHCKSGGDLVQAKAYKRELEQYAGNQVSFAHAISREKLFGIEWDVVQLFNISRLYENLETIKHVRYRKLLLTPIMQPGFSFNQTLFLKAFIRGLFFGSFISFPRKEFVKQSLSRFDGFVFLSNLEYKDFYDKFDFLKMVPFTIYHNGISDTLPNYYERLFDFIVVGRIEPLKGVIRAIKAVRRFNKAATICCVGALNWYHPVYCLCFLSYVIRGNVIFTGKRSSEFVATLFQQSSVLLNMSELEVSPLVDLEALACGCSVISTIYSYTHLSENDRYIRVDVKYDDSIHDALLKIADVNNKSDKILIPTWKDNSYGYIKFIDSMS